MKISTPPRAILVVLSLLIIWVQSVVAQQSSQVFFDAAATSGLQEQFYKNSVLRSSSGHLYVCGATINLNGDYDMLLTKLTSSNTVVWSVTYGGSAGGDDYAADLIEDSNGDIIVTGAEYVSATDYDAITIKYNSSGVQQWTASYDGGINALDGGTSLIRDGSDNIYVTGGSYGLNSLSDFLCIKYNSQGTQQWANTWDSASLQDVAVRLALASDGISVIGGAQQTANSWKMATVKFNASTGAFIASKLTGGDAEDIDKVADLAVDSSDNTYVVGAVQNVGNGYDIKVVKLNSTLEVVWEDTFNGGSGLDDEGLSLELDSNDDIVICGYTESSSNGKDIVVRKFNGTSGNVLWTNTFDAHGGDDEAIGMKLDDGDNPVICASSFKDGNLDYLIQKRKAVSGSVIWTGRWNSDYNLDDVPMNLVIDETGDAIYVAGQADAGNGNYKYKVTKWTERQVYMPSPSGGFFSSAGYIQNRGQLRNDDGTSNNTVRFYCQKRSPSTYIDNDKISYQFTSLTLDTTITDTIHRVDMKFNKGSGSAKVYPSDERDEYYNFYLAHMSQKAERTSSYNALVKSGVYDHTDVIFTHNESGYRHWIVARAGAPTADFEMEYSGQDSLYVDSNGDLNIQTAIGTHTQPKAKVYELNHGTGQLTALTWQPDYVVSGDLVSFQYTGTWSGTLVIELQNEQTTFTTSTTTGNLDWSTFTGNTGFDQSLDVTSDEQENVWVTGEQRDEVFINAPGELFVNGGFADLGDVFVAHFEPDCELDYFTAWGGDNLDTGYGITTGSSGQTFVVGFTQSPATINWAPTGNLDDNSLNGISDGFLLKLSAGGFIILDSYIGGDGADLCTSVAYQAYAIDTNGDGVDDDWSTDLWIVGYGNNPSNFPTQSFGLYNQAHAGGHDGFIMRLVDGNQSLEWCSWFGSDENDFICDVDIVSSDPVFIGITESNGYSTSLCSAPADGGFPNCSGGGLHWQWPWVDSGASGLNYFLGRFNDIDVSLRWTTFHGAAFWPFNLAQHKPAISTYSEGFTEESPGFVFVAGSHMNLYASDFPIVSSGSPSGYNQDTPGSDGEDIFLSRFRVVGNTTNLTWSTFIGSENTENAYGLATDDSQRIYLTGWLTSDDLQPQTDWCDTPNDDTFPLCNANGQNYMETDELNTDDQRALIMAFDFESELLWSTQFGDGAINVGRGISVGSEKLFLVGRTDEAWTEYEFDVNSDADYFQPFRAGLRDGAIARFDIPTIVQVEETFDLDQEGELIAFPNPASGETSFRLKTEEFLSGQLMIYNSLGQLVHNTLLQQDSPTYSLSIDNYPPGVYTCIIDNSKQSFTCRFIIE